MSDFRGIWVALATPFRCGQVDFEALQGLVNKLLADGVRGLVVCGTTGEAAAMSEDEQLAVLDAVLAEGNVELRLTAQELRATRVTLKLNVI